MSYIPNLVGKDEKLVGIARLHWIYIVHGLIWFLILAYLGAFTEGLIMSMVMTVDSALSAVNIGQLSNILAYITSTLMSLASSVNTFQTMLGALILGYQILKVMMTEIGLTTRRVIYKRGLMSVKVKQIDLEEIRGENLDLGMFGRFFNYGHIKLDCRFIGDVRLPAIGQADKFMKALHHHRTQVQTLTPVVEGTEPSKAPEMAALPDEVSAKGKTPHTPQPAEPEIMAVATAAAAAVLAAQQQQAPAGAPPAPTPPSMEQAQTPHDHGVHATVAEVQHHKAFEPLAEQAKPVTVMDPEAVAQVVKEVVPQVAEQVVKQMKEEGIIPDPAAPQPDADKPAPSVEDELAVAFDHAAVVKKPAEGAKPEYSIH